MFWKLVSAAVIAVVAGVGAANAQSAKDLKGPSELPPASFKGQQYVDSRGCVFVRAGMSGKTNWVARVSANRKQLCGQTPTFAKIEIPVVPDASAKPTVVVKKAEPVAPQVVVRQAMPKVAVKAAIPPESYVPPPVVMTKKKQVVVKPMAVAPVVAPVVATPKVAPVNRGTGVVVGKSGYSGGKIGCYTDAPVAERFALRGGGSIVLCTKGDGDINSGRPPRLSEGQGTMLQVSSQDIVPPPGYKVAWRDDRLNPLRGQGTAEGWAEQNNIWTERVPAESARGAARKAGIGRENVAASSMRAAVGKSYVQVGAFAQASNAAAVKRNLASLGLPVSATRSGRLETILIGPFSTHAELLDALATARYIGYRDAFLR